jgi:hypothetical protein
MLLGSVADAWPEPHHFDGAKTQCGSNGSGSAADVQHKMMMKKNCTPISNRFF